jgi:hypothetical protein
VSPPRTRGTQRERKALIATLRLAALAQWVQSIPVIAKDPKRTSVVAAINMQELKTCDAADFAQQE